MWLATIQLLELVAKMLMPLSGVPAAAAEGSVSSNMFLMIPHQSLSWCRSLLLTYMMPLTSTMSRMILAHHSPQSSGGRKRRVESMYLLSLTYQQKIKFYHVGCYSSRNILVVGGCIWKETWKLIDQKHLVINYILSIKENNLYIIFPHSYNTRNR